MGKLVQKISGLTKRKQWDTAHPFGHVIHEIADLVDAHDLTISGGGDIGTNATNIATLQTEVETATTGLLDRVTALETADTADDTAVSTLQTEVETATTGLLDRTTALETAKTTDEANIATNTTNITQIQGSGVVAVPVSFAAGSVGDYTVYFPAKVTINKLRAFVNLALAATDAGTIQAANNAGTSMGTGLITIALSSAFGTEVSVTPTTNNVLTAGQKLQLTTAKTTAGGTAIVYVEYTVTP